MKYCMHSAACDQKVQYVWSGAAGVLLHLSQAPVSLFQQLASSKNRTGCVPTAHRRHPSSDRQYQLHGPQARARFSTIVLNPESRRLLLLSQSIAQVPGARSAHCWGTMQTVSAMTRVVRHLAFFRTMASASSSYTRSACGTR